MKASVLLAAVGTLALAGTAFANETKTYQGTGGPLTDAVSVGGVTTPGVTVFTIIVADTGEIKGIKEVLLSGLVHTWAGDLLITLTHGATTVTLVDRPGFPALGFGESENYNGNYSFQDGFAPIPDEFPNDPLASGIYGPHAGESLSSFVGLDKAGAWILTITDNAAADTGSLGSWTLVLNNVPAPGALALLGVAGLAARRRRRSA
jgi:MYXO-CTERM domain-containing protein